MSIAELDTLDVRSGCSGHLCGGFGDVSLVETGWTAYLAHDKEIKSWAGRDS